MLSPDTPISAFIPLSSHVARDVVKTTGGDYSITWTLAGWPFMGRDMDAVQHSHGAFNRLLQSLRAPDYANVAFWVHDIRRACAPPPQAYFRQPFNQALADAYSERLGHKRMMRNELYITLLYRPDVGARFVERSADVAVLQQQQDQAIAQVHELAEHLETVLREHAPRRLGMYTAGNGVVFSETLAFHGYLLNGVEEPVPVLSASIADYLATCRHTFSSRTGDLAIQDASGATRYGAILNIKEYPAGTWPGVLNGLKYLDCDYVVTHSFTPMGRHEALKALDRTKGMMISSGDKAVSQIVELNHAMDQLASGNFVLGEYHFSMALFAEALPRLGQQVAAARAELSNAGFVAVKEDLAVAPAFYAQLPGNWRYRPRLANLSSLNFIGLSPLHNFAGGKPARNPWGPCIATLQTTNGQPYHFNFHATHVGEDSTGEKAIGNTLVIGKSGTGKTALINFLISQSQKIQPEPCVFFFDKDRGAEIFIRACGGDYLALENGQPTGFNPFHCQRSERNVQFLVDLVRMLAGKPDYSASEEEDIHRAVEAVLDTPLHLRSMDSLRKSLPNMGDDGLYARLRRWTAGHSLGWVFDNPADHIDMGRSSMFGVDYTELIDNPEVRAPVIRYLVHRLEEIIDGRPLIYVMDEFWKILEGDGGLKEFAKNKQKTIRKQNGLGIFATQSPEDALRSDIAAAIIEQTATLVLLPNPNASRADYMEGLKLTEAEFEVVRSLDERSRCFLVKQGHAVSVCRLDLQGMDDALSVISASTDNIAVLHDVLQGVAARLDVPSDQLQPGQWLAEFFQRRKGAGRGAAAAHALAAPISSEAE